MSSERTPVRISFLIGTLAIGGAETQLVRLVNGLDRSRFNPSIVCMEGRGDLEDLVAPDVPVVHAQVGLRIGRPGGLRARRALRILSAVLEPLREGRPEIVHAYLPMAYVIGGIAAWMLRVPVIIASRRGLTTFEGAGKIVARFANSVIDMQICNSGAVRDYAIAKEGIPIERTCVIPNGIDAPALGKLPDIPAGWRSSGGQAAMVANLIRYKGHREVLRAMRIVVKSHPEFRLVLFGDGPEREVLEEMTKQMALGRNIVFAGRRRDAADLMPAFDFVVLGSSEEGFPNVLLESLAHGVPVVSTAVGGVAELVGDGFDGRLVQFGDIDQMASALAWMLEHPAERRRMGAMGRRRVETQFSTQRMVQSTQAVYEKLLSTRRIHQPAQLERV